MPSKELVRLGSGSAHGSDLLDPSIALAESGEIDYLVFDCLSEKAILDNEVTKARGGIAWDPFQEHRMRKTIPACARTGTKIITNMGAADPGGAGMRTAEICRELGFPQLKVVAVAGDYMIDEVRKLDPIVSETSGPASALGDRLLAAYAYISGQGIVQALRMGADIVVSGRVGDSTQFLAPLIYEFDWPSDRWDILAKGQGIGHLLECAAQLTGGYFADPPYKVVHDLHRVGFPIARVDANGDAIITKLPGTGGLVNRLTVIEQLLYEIGDPSDYKHTDVTVDFTTTEITDIGPNAVSVTGTTGHPKPPTVKVCLGVHEGYMGVGRVMYGGGGAHERAQLTANTLAARFEMQGMDSSKMRFDYEGVDALFAWQGHRSAPREVRLRVAGLFPTLAEAEIIPFEMNALASCTGASGTAWGRNLEGGTTEEIVGLYTTYVPQDSVVPEVIDVTGAAESAVG